MLGLGGGEAREKERTTLNPLEFAGGGGGGGGGGEINFIRITLHSSSN